MKNIHVLPTDKPSRLYFNTKAKYYAFSYTVTSQGGSVSNRHIYITSDEEIKEGDYWLNLDRNDINNGELFDIANMAPSCKKIILTTDQDLIKDGVQAIDDEFLEWFVKNPSCEFVEVDKEEDELVSPKNPKIRFNYLQDPPSFISAESLNNMILTYKYKIIIPQEEPKQETLEEACKRIKNELDYSEFDYTSFKLGAKWQQEQDKNRLLEYVKQEACDNCNNDVCCCIIKKQETLEKVSPMNDLLKDLRETKISVKESIDTIEDEFMRTQINIFVQKTLDSVIYRIENELLEIESKWQQEQDKNKYSDEDMIAFGNKMQLVSDVDFDGNIKFAFDPSQAIKQFKKK